MWTAAQNRFSGTVIAMGCVFLIRAFFPLQSSGLVIKIFTEKKDVSKAARKANQKS